MLEVVPPTLHNELYSHFRWACQKKRGKRLCWNGNGTVFQQKENPRKCLESNVFAPSPWEERRPNQKKIMPERSRMCVLYLHLCWHILYPCASGLNGLSIFNLWPQMFITCPRWYLESWLFISSLTSLMLTCLPRCLGSRRSNLCRAMENQPFTAKSSTNEKLSTAVVDYQRVCFTQPE